MDHQQWNMCSKFERRYHYFPGGTNSGCSWTRSNILWYNGCAGREYTGYRSRGMELCACRKPRRVAIVCLLKFIIAYQQFYRYSRQYLYTQVDYHKRSMRSIL